MKSMLARSKSFLAGAAGVLAVVALALLGVIPPLIVAMVLVAVAAEACRDWLYRRGKISRYDGNGVWRRVDGSVDTKRR